MTAMINGIGTKLYGQCDWRADRSHQTTEWFVMLYFPVIPLKSLRIRNVGGNRYQVLEELPLAWAQVARVYAFALNYLVMFPVLLGIAANLSSSTLGDTLKTTLMTLLVAAACAPLGWLFWSRRRAASDALSARPRTR